MSGNDRRRRCPDHYVVGRRQCQQAGRKNGALADCYEGRGSLFLAVPRMKHRCFLIGAAVFALAAANATEHSILLVDDADILYRSGTKRVLCPLTHSPANPILKSGVFPWETAIAWTSVYRDPATGKYQLWYQAFAGDASRDRTRRCVVSYAESDDGLKFNRPNLGLFDFNDIKERSTRLNSSHRCISYAVFCLKKKTKHTN